MSVDTLRASIIRTLWPAGDQLLQDQTPSAQYDALKAGAPVTFTTAQLVGIHRVSETPDQPWSHVHPSLPDNLEAHDSWVLSGTDTLTPG